jgi:cyclopropane-fatty-acyl-phospholipid synthase
MNQDFLAYTSPDPYDAMVILGAMEHPPDYHAVLRQFLRVLQPDGRVRGGSRMSAGSVN